MIMVSVRESKYDYRANDKKNGNTNRKPFVEFCYRSCKDKQTAEGGNGTYTNISNSMEQFSNVRHFLSATMEVCFAYCPQ